MSEISKLEANGSEERNMRIRSPMSVVTNSLTKENRAYTWVVSTIASFRPALQ